MNYISDILYWISTGLLVPVIVITVHTRPAVHGIARAAHGVFQIHDADSFCFEHGNLTKRAETENSMYRLPLSAYNNNVLYHGEADLSRRTPERRTEKIKKSEKPIDNRAHVCYNSIRRQ